jgi:ribonuclease H2 subunit A
MVYGVAVSPISNSAALKKRDFADSKVLTAEKRDELFDELQSDEALCCVVDEIPASKISGLMLAPEKVSLNTIAFDSTVGLVQKCLDSNINVQEVYVDTVGSAASYQERLSNRFPGIKFTVKPKADAIYPIVSAASIAAKVSRDRCIEKLEGERGSGYPSDPKTKEWLNKSVDVVFGFDDAVRFSWGTAEKILSKSGIPVEWECDDEGDAKISFTSQGQKRSLDKRHSYFNARRLQKSRI